MNQSRARITHELKTWPEFFVQTRHGRKRFELRRNDRDFQMGDELRLQEWNPTEGRKPGENGVAFGYTGRELLVRVDYIMASEQVDTIMGHVDTEFPGVGPDYVIMSVSLVS